MTFKRTTRYRFHLSSWFCSSQSKPLTTKGGIHHGCINFTLMPVGPTKIFNILLWSPIQEFSLALFFKFPLKVAVSMEVPRSKQILINFQKLTHFRTTWFLKEQMVRSPNQRVLGSFFDHFISLDHQTMGPTSTESGNISPTTMILTNRLRPSVLPKLHYNWCKNLNSCKIYQKS